MKIWISSIALSLVASLPWSVAAADHVKSLQFGGRYSERELARLFPGAKCRAHGQSDQSICTIPTTLLGRPTVAEAFRDKQDRLIDFTAFLPEADRKLPRQADTAKVELPALMERYSAGVIPPSES